jgi:hypothetical protein
VTRSETHVRSELLLKAPFAAFDLDPAGVRPISSGVQRSGHSVGGSMYPARCCAVAAGRVACKPYISATLYLYVPVGITLTSILRVRANKETTLPTRSNQAQSGDARARADASFKKEERAKDGAKAMMEYQANGRALREKTERLKALRLAKEAADKKAEGVAKAATGKR